MLVLQVGIAAPAEAISKKRADAIAKRIGKVVDRRHVPAIMFGLRKPVPAGTQIYDGGPGPTNRGRTRFRDGGATGVTTDRTRKLRRAAWVYWLDLAPTAAFSHPSVLIVLDAGTGSEVRVAQFSWWPLINGRRAPWHRSLRAYASKRYKVFDRFTPTLAQRAATTSTRVGVFVNPTAPARIAADPPAPPDLSKDCLIMIGDRADPVFKGSFAQVEESANKIGLRVVHATHVKDLREKIKEVKAAKFGCKDIAIYIGGHGSRPGDVKGPGAESRQGEITISWKNRNGGKIKIWNTIKSSDVRLMLQVNGDVTFKLLIDSCYAGRWIDDLRTGVNNIRIIATAAKRDQVAFTPAENNSWAFYGKQKNGQLIKSVTRQVPADPTTNPHHASGFGNGIARGLESWATDPAARERSGDDFGKGIKEAFDRQGEQNLPEQRGWQEGQVLDRTDEVREVGQAPSQPPGLQGEGQFAFAQGFPNEVSFQIAFSQPVGGFTIELPADRKVTNCVPPPGQQCGLSGSRLICRGALPAGQTANGRIEMNPGPSAGMGGTLYGRSGETDVMAGTISGP